MSHTVAMTNMKLGFHEYEDSDNLKNVMFNYSF